MVEFTHRKPEPDCLVRYREAHPNALHSDFDAPDFHPVKLALKRLLNHDQFGLCAYCESLLAPDEGQIDHIKPMFRPVHTGEFGLHRADLQRLQHPAAAQNGK